MYSKPAERFGGGRGAGNNNFKSDYRGGEEVEIVADVVEIVAEIIVAENVAEIVEAIEEAAVSEADEAAEVW